VFFYWHYDYKIIYKCFFIDIMGSKTHPIHSLTQKIGFFQFFGSVVVVCIANLIWYNPVSAFDETQQTKTLAYYKHFKIHVFYFHFSYTLPHSGLECLIVRSTHLLIHYEVKWIEDYCSYLIISILRGNISTIGNKKN